MPVALSVLSARPSIARAFSNASPMARVVSGPKTRPSRNGVIGMVCLPTSDACISPAVGDDLKVCAPSSSFACPRLNDLIVCESGIGLSVGVSLFMPRSASRDAHHADTLPGVAHGGRTVRRRQGARPARAVAAAVLAGFAAASLQRQVAGLARPTPSRAMLAVSPPAAPARPTDYGTWSR